jgi:hypothetical protein
LLFAITASEGLAGHEESAGVLYEQMCFGLQVILVDVMYLLPLQPVHHLSISFCRADVEVTDFYCGMVSTRVGTCLFFFFFRVFLHVSPMD